MVHISTRFVGSVAVNLESGQRLFCKENMTSSITFWTFWVGEGHNSQASPGFTQWYSSKEIYCWKLLWAVPALQVVHSTLNNLNMDKMSKTMYLIQWTTDSGGLWFLREEKPTRWCLPTFVSSTVWRQFLVRNSENGGSNRAQCSLTERDQGWSFNTISHF